MIEDRFAVEAVHERSIADPRRPFNALRAFTACS